MSKQSRNKKRSPPGPPPDLKSAKKIIPKPNELENTGLNLKRVEEKDKNYKTLLDLYLDLEKNVKRKTKKLKPEEIDWRVWHGSMGNPDMKPPVCIAKTDMTNRGDQGNFTNASEFQDHPEVLEEKMKIVADLISKSKFCVAYTGAGISRPSGIGDYASKAKNSLMKEYKLLTQPVFAEPTFSHHVLSTLQRNSLLHYYVQQNHDGLPQKAGFPQHLMNEIHGAWFDITNPVVSFKGNLRSDLYQDMLEIEEKTDLVLCLGTSLSGMNSDRIVWTPCEKYSSGMKECFGSVIINLQFVPVDNHIGYVPIRVWSKIDDAFRLLVKYLGIEVEKKEIQTFPEDRVEECPYDEKGRYDPTKKMVVDLSHGKYVQVVQPGAFNKGRIGKVVGKDRKGNFLLRFRKRDRRLGSWWLADIKKGKLKQIPFVNVSHKPNEKKKKKKKKN